MGNNMETHKTYITPIPDKCDYCNSKPTLMVIIRVGFLLKATRFVEWGFVCAKHKDKLALYPPTKDGWLYSMNIKQGVETWKTKTKKKRCAKCAERKDTFITPIVF